MPVRVWGRDCKGSSSPSSPSASLSPSLLCQEHEPCQRTLSWRGSFMGGQTRLGLGEEGRKVIAVVTKGGEEGRKGDVSPREREIPREREDKNGYKYTQLSVCLESIPHHSTPPTSFIFSLFQHQQTQLNLYLSSETKPTTPKAQNGPTHLRRPRCRRRLRRPSPRYHPVRAGPVLLRLQPPQQP